MRHFFIARPVATLPGGVAAASRRTTLIALSGTLNRPTTGTLSAVRGTIDLATIATAADHDLQPTAYAEKQPR
jgi:hypothetical protein